MSDTLNARTITVAPGPVMPIGPLLTTGQLAHLAQQLRDDLAAASAEREAARKAGRPTACAARRIAATRASLFDLGAR